MKTLILFVLCTLLCLQNIHAQNKTKKAKQKAAPVVEETDEQRKVKGRFFFRDGELHNLGVLKSGRVVLDTFWFENIGNSPFRISYITPSSNIISADWTKDQVRPEKIGFISVVIRTNKKMGPFNDKLFIQSDALNPKGKNFYTLYLKGDIRAGGKGPEKKKSAKKK